MYVCASVSIDKRIDTNSDITHAHITSDFMWKMVKFMRSQRFFVKQSTEVEKPSKTNAVKSTDSKEIYYRRV